jgi:hypothetical protein
LIWYNMVWYDKIYLTAIGLTPDGSSKAHIYTQIIHRIHNTQNTVDGTGSSSGSYYNCLWSPSMINHFLNLQCNAKYSANIVMIITIFGLYKLMQVSFTIYVCNNPLLSYMIEEDCYTSKPPVGYIVCVCLHQVTVRSANFNI